MGTRSLTKFIDEHGNHIMTMYRQYDGYMEGHGKDLAKFLSGIKLINGISGRAEIGEHANGMGCLAAQVIAHFKDSVGAIYIVQPKDGESESFDYVVQPLSKVDYVNRESQVKITVMSLGEKLFEGSATEMLNELQKMAEQ